MCRCRDYRFAQRIPGLSLPQVRWLCGRGGERPLVALDPRWIVLLHPHARRSGRDAEDARGTVSFSISDTFTFTTLLLLGPGPATITASLEALTISCFLSPEQRRATRIFFNIAAVGLAMWIAGAVLVAFEGGQGAGSLLVNPGGWPWRPPQR